MKISVFIVLFILAISQTLAQETGILKGKITYGGGKTPIRGASVKILPLNISTNSEDDGSYEIRNIPKGMYTVLVHFEGFVDTTKQIEIKPGETLQEDFDLRISSLRAEVTVTSSGKEQSVFESFQSVESVTSNRIIEKASTSIGEVLENETGIAKRSFGTGTSRPVIRGFDGDRVLILQDGMRSGSISSQSGDHGEPLDPLSAERIEVVKGPATLLYGSNALGGVVNVINTDENEAHTGFRGFLTGLAGSADKQAASTVGLEYGIGKFVTRGNLSYNRTGDYKTPIGKIPNSASRSTSGSFGFGYYGNLTWISGTYNSDLRRYGIPFANMFGDETSEKENRYGIPFANMFVDETNQTENKEIDLRLSRQNFRIKGGFRNFDNSFLSDIQYNLDYTKYQHKEIEVIAGVDNPGTTFDNKIFSYRVLFNQKNYKASTGRFGFEGFNRKYRITGEEQLIQGKVRHEAFSSFVLQELNFEKVKVQFGGRIERNRYRPENPELLSRDFTGFSGAVGVNFALWKNASFIANYTHSYRSPALEELYNNGPHIGNVTFEIGNKALRSEISNGIDFSLRQNSKRLTFTGDFFYYRINRFVFLAPQDENGDGQVDIEDGLPVAKYEQADAEYYGGEIYANANFSQYLNGFFSFDAVRAKLTDRNINVPRIPPARFKLGLDIRYKNLTLRPETLFATSQNKTYPLETRTAGYGIINLAASYLIAKPKYAHIFTLFGYNLTDKLYRNHLSFIKDFAPEIGRGIRFGYTIRFF